MNAPAGALRVFGTGQPWLVPHELKVEVMQANGEWLPLHNVTRIRMDIDAGQKGFVSADMSLFIYELNLVGVEQGKVSLERLPRWWQGSWSWERVRRLLRLP